MKMPHTLRMKTVGPATAKTCMRIFEFLSALGPGGLLEQSLGSGACGRCGSTSSSGALSVVVDLRQEHRRCPDCDLILDGSGTGFGRRLPSGRVVLQEVVLIQR